MTEPQALAPRGCCEFCGAPKDEHGCSTTDPAPGEFRTLKHIVCRKPSAQKLIEDMKRRGTWW